MSAILETVKAVNKDLDQLEELLKDMQKIEKEIKTNQTEDTTKRMNQTKKLFYDHAIKIKNQIENMNKEIKNSDSNAGFLKYSYAFHSDACGNVLAKLKHAGEKIHLESITSTYNNMAMVAKIVNPEITDKDINEMVKNNYDLSKVGISKVVANNQLNALNERTAMLKGMLDSAQQIEEMTNMLNTMVKDNGNMLRTLEEDNKVTFENIKEAGKQLENAWWYEKKRNKIIICVATAVVVIIIIIIVVSVIKSKAS